MTLKRKLSNHTHTRHRQGLSFIRATGAGRPLHKRTPPLPLLSADPGRANDTRTEVRGVRSRIDSQRKREKKREIDGMTICSRVGKNGITLGAHHLEGGC
ncbi:hypothetical protein TNIN_149161 [Trichonephila inaurata madagascariensis]|uniref:Uncharacterized protein n=1 Tax=Trichonephila inaurata madagascariensis TaxID=2747483 RepID=A0A8X6X6Z9_9ARAC|nr:hypothetical protein TNIN_149161 [Trichonephila inaurata madagascariensis]